MTCFHCRSNAAYRTPTGWVCDVCGHYQPADAADYQWYGLPLGRVVLQTVLIEGCSYQDWLAFLETRSRVKYECWGPSILYLPTERLQELRSQWEDQYKGCAPGEVKYLGHDKPRPRPDGTYDVTYDVTYNFELGAPP